MLHPAAVNIVSFFYPLGNTPAVCLTQDLPPEERADILLLGCGDVRNILFTAYAESSLGSRQLDITCCDIERAVLARNVLLFTLLLDDINGLNDASIWNIYYHLFLDAQSLKLLQTQAKKLCGLAASLDGWHRGKYGRLLRFSDRTTLRRITDIWSSYSASDMTKDEKATHDQRFKVGIQKAVDARNKHFGPGLSLVLTGYRSAAPVSILALQDLPQLYQHFWDHGATDNDPITLSRAKHSNPMFASLVTDTFTLHYGTDPLLGFHLATAYASLAPDSPLYPKASSDHLHKLVAAARLQFQTWSASFRRKASQNWTIRFSVADALAFCHTLQHLRETGSGESAQWYRMQYQLEALVLDSSDYKTGGKAPLSFHIIDTSNLNDHVGAINILVATAPLLANNISATLYIESLVRVAEDHQELMDRILCGHFPTVSILLGLFPVEYWTNATAISTVDDGLIESMPTLMGNKDTNKGQVRIRIVCKRPISSLGQILQPPAKLRLDEQALANTLHQVYLGMFRNEDLKVLFSNVSLLALQTNSNPHYHRGSFASFLRLVKGRVTTDWDKMMEALLPLLENEPTILMGMNYIQEFYLYLHLLDVYTMPTFLPSFNQKAYGADSLGLASWNAIPGIVCITLQVPRERLGVFTRLAPEVLGTPNVHCILQSTGTNRSRAWQNIFAAVHLTFGTITPSNPKNKDDFHINITEDENGWTGRSPLLVSFYAPTWMVLLEPRNTTIAFGVQSTPYSTYTFVKTLGLEMKVYETKLANVDNVYITKYLPNLSGYTSICKLETVNAPIKGPSNADTGLTITAEVDQLTPRIASFMGRIDFFTEESKSLLRDQSLVETLQLSECSIVVLVGKCRTRHIFYFPAPVQNSQAKIRIARKSSYVEIVVPIVLPTAKNHTFPRFMYPVIQPEKHSPIIWNMPYLNLDCMPVLSTENTNAMQWLMTHASLQFSARERKLRGASTSSTSIINHRDVRINLKSSLFSIFMRYTGLQGQQAHIFGINNPTKGGVHMLIFASCLRLDIADHTVVLDSAVLPLTNQLVRQIGRFLGPLSAMGLCSIIVDDEELKLWKELLPCYVERCRTWTHKPSCEYLAKAKIPLSVEEGEPLLCSCGDGKLPTGFISDIPGWDLVSKYAVRAAISPSFSVSFVEPAFDLEEMKRDIGPGVHRCQNCRKTKSESGKSLLTCSKCHVTKYCSIKCQTADWKMHKKICCK